MRTVFVIGILLVIIAGCAYLAEAQGADKPTASSELLIADSQVTVIAPTNTPVPTATIDYQTTALVAQQTADEARRVNAVVTAQFEQRVQEQLQMTAEHEQRVQEIYSWTQQAAGTSIPLTATQQVYANTLTSAGMTQESSLMSATAVYPTQVVSAARAENFHKYGWMEDAASIFGLLILCVFLIALTVYLFYMIRIERARAEDDDSEDNEVEEEPEPKDMVMHVVDTSGAGYNSRRMVLPLDDIHGPELLDEFAAGILSKTKTLGINHWEGEGTSWTRDLYLPFRAWMIDPYNEVERKRKPSRPLAISNERNQLVPTSALYEFLNTWVNTRKLSDEYEFAEAEAETVGEWAPEGVVS